MSDYDLLRNKHPIFYRLCVETASAITLNNQNSIDSASILRVGAEIEAAMVQLVVAALKENDREQR